MRSISTIGVVSIAVAIVAAFFATAGITLSDVSTYVTMLTEYLTEVLEALQVWNVPLVKDAAKDAFDAAKNALLTLGELIFRITLLIYAFFFHYGGRMHSSLIEWHCSLSPRQKLYEGCGVMGVIFAKNLLQRPRRMHQLFRLTVLRVIDVIARVVIAACILYIRLRAAIIGLLSAEDLPEEDDTNNAHDENNEPPLQQQNFQVAESDTTGDDTNDGGDQTAMQHS